MIKELTSVDDDERNCSTTTKGVVTIRNAPKDFLQGVLGVSFLGVMSGVATSYFGNYEGRIVTWTQVKNTMVTETKWWTLLGLSFYTGRELMWQFRQKNDEWANFVGGFMFGLVYAVKNCRERPVVGLAMAGLFGTIAGGTYHFLDPASFDLGGNARVFANHEAFQRYAELTTKHKSENDIHLLKMEQEAFKKLDSRQ